MQNLLAELVKENPQHYSNFTMTVVEFEEMLTKNYKARNCILETNYSSSKGEKTLIRIGHNF